MEILKAILTIFVGFVVSALSAHQIYFKKRLPRVKRGKLQILPNLIINIKDYKIHIHHWIWMSLVFAYVNHIAKGMNHLLYLKFFAIGVISQGLSFKDRFKILIKQEKSTFRLPKISVVIPAYNEQNNIHEVLDSLKIQDYPNRKFEIIVADNGSTDNTVVIAKRYGAKIVHVLQKGAAYTRQAGFEKATGEIITTTDADTTLPKNWLLTIAFEFAKRPKAVMISGMYDFYDGNLLLRFATWVFNYRLFAIFGWYSGANMGVRREAFIKVGGFDTSLPLSEDSDLGIRLRKLGQVVRLANFKVKTSARRFNRLGFFGGLWDYSSNYFKFKLNLKPLQNVTFRAGSEVPKIGLLPKLAINMFVAGAILVGLFGSIFEIKPVRAEIIKSGKQISHHIPKNFQNDLLKVNHTIRNVHYTHSK